MQSNLTVYLPVVCSSMLSVLLVMFAASPFELDSMANRIEGKTDAADRRMSQTDFFNVKSVTESRQRRNRENCS